MEVCFNLNQNKIFMNKNKELIEKIEKWLDANPWLENCCIVIIVVGLSYLTVVTLSWLLSFINF